MKHFSIFLFLSFCVLVRAAAPSYQPSQFTTNLAKASPSNSVFVVTNSASGWGHWVLFTNGGGGVGSGVLDVQSNGVTIASTVTNLDFTGGTNIDWKLTNSPAGHVHLSAHLNPAVTTGASNYTDARLAGFVQNLSGQATNLTVRSPNGGPPIALTVETNSLVVTNSRVGVGTNDPQARLHVVADGTKTNILSLGTVQTNDLVNADTNGNVWAYSGFRRSTNSLFEDDEWVTESHLQTLLESLEGFTFFLRTNAHPVVAGTLATRLTRETTDQFLTNALSAGSNQVAIWFSTNFVSSGVIPAGSYDFHVHARKTAAGPDAIIGFDLVRTNGSGISTLASGETNAIPTTTESSFLMSVHLDSPVIVSPTDYIGVRYYAIRGGGAVSVITHVGGTTDSHFTTPNFTSGAGEGVSVSVSSNGVIVASTATNLDFINVPLMTNSNGNVSIDLTPQQPALESFILGQTMFDDFLYVAGSGTISALGSFSWQAGVSGGTEGIQNGETNAPGIWRMVSGGSDGNFCHLNMITTSGGGYGAFTFGQMTVTNTWRARVNPIPTIADGGTYVWGFGDSTPNVTFTDGVWFEINTNRALWVCLCASNGVVVGVTNTSVTPVANTWYTLGIQIDSQATAATFWVNGSPIATNSGTVPKDLAARAVGLVTGSRKRAGATQMTNDLDYCYLSYRLNGTR